MQMHLQLQVAATLDVLYAQWSKILKNSANCYKYKCIHYRWLHCLPQRLKSTLFEFFSKEPLQDSLGGTDRSNLKEIFQKKKPFENNNILNNSPKLHFYGYFRAL